MKLSESFDKLVNVLKSMKPSKGFGKWLLVSVIIGSTPIWLPFLSPITSGEQVDVIKVLAAGDLLPICAVIAGEALIDQSSARRNDSTKSLTVGLLQFARMCCIVVLFCSGATYVSILGNNVNLAADIRNDTNQVVQASAGLSKASTDLRKKDEQALQTAQQTLQTVENKQTTAINRDGFLSIIMYVCTIISSGACKYLAGEESKEAPHDPLLQEQGAGKKVSPSPSP